MTDRFTGYAKVALVFWFLTVTAILVWSKVPGSDIGWDLNVYRHAIESMQVGQDPYLVGIKAQDIFHKGLAFHPNAPPPYTYVYSPLSLPLLKEIGLFPFRLTAIFYWSVYFAGLFLAIWVGMYFVEQRERHVFMVVAPAVVFFPGLLQSDIFFSGNVAYIVYGILLVTALQGWRRGQWIWFYLALFAVSPCKTPLLTLLAVPVLSAPKQWLAAGFTGTVSLILFSAQKHIWPSLFHNYLHAVELQFSYNHDFGFSPAGLIANLLYDEVPYQKTIAIVYLLLTVFVLSVLLYLRKKFFAKAFPLKQWVPVMLIGVILLNPRIMEYDVAAITIPMALVAWRFFTRISNSSRQAITGVSVFFILINVLAAPLLPKHSWKLVECLALVAIFLAGAWTLQSPLREVSKGTLELAI